MARIAPQQQLAYTSTMLYAQGSGVFAELAKTLGMQLLISIAPVLCTPNLAHLSHTPHHRGVFAHRGKGHQAHVQVYRQNSHGAPGSVRVPPPIGVAPHDCMLLLGGSTTGTLWILHDPEAPGARCCWHTLANVTRCVGG